MESIADNIIYLYIEKQNNNLIIGAIKIKEGNKSTYSKTINIQDIDEIKLLVNFLEDMEVVVYDAGFVRKSLVNII